MVEKSSIVLKVYNSRNNTTENNFHLFILTSVLNQKEKENNDRHNADVLNLTMYGKQQMY